MPPRKAAKTVQQRNIALCYIRQSYTEDEEDKASPDRQRALIAARVEQEGWIAEWYEDVEGHKSARFVNNRPAWLQLKKRLSDPDVIALVTLDLARLHRKGWRIGDLLDQLETDGVRLVFTRQGYELDTSTYNGKFVAQITAMLDEAYAEDVSRRTKAAVAFLKAQGKNVGRPPFGTIRTKEGYLEPSRMGFGLSRKQGASARAHLTNPLSKVPSGAVIMRAPIMFWTSMPKTVLVWTRSPIS